MWKDWKKSGRQENMDGNCIWKKRKKNLTEQAHTENLDSNRNDHGTWTCWLWLHC